MSPKSGLPCLLPALLIAMAMPCALAPAQALDPKMHHLRSGAVREWDEFPGQAESRELTLRFDFRANAAESTLRLRHRDLKQTWAVILNGKEVAKLPLDENEMVTYWPVPLGALHDGGNELRIACATAEPSDDILVGEIELLSIPREKA